MGWGWLGIDKGPVELAPRLLATGAILLLLTSVSGLAVVKHRPDSSIVAQSPVLDLMALVMS